MAEIFLSYSRADKPTAERIAEAFRDEDFSVFFDARIGIGDSWDDVIERELTAAEAIVVLWSPDSRNSDWVRNEARAGLRRSILAPVIIRETTLPTEFDHVQAADLRRWSGSRDHPEWRRLIQRIASVSRTPGAARKARPQRPGRALMAAIAAAVVLLIAGATFMAQRALAPPQNGTPPSEATAPQTTATPGDADMLLRALSAASYAPSEEARVAIFREITQREPTDRERSVLASMASHAAAPAPASVAAPPPQTTTQTPPQRPPPQQTQSRPPAQNVPSSAAASTPNTGAMFDMPLQGAIISRYGAQPGGGRLDGIEIAADEGAVVRAAGSGEVVYAGADLQAYGTMILIRHADNYVTAYAFGRRALVREGQRVDRGDPILEVGPGAPRPRLLFQVRRGSDALDPLPLLRR